MRNDMKEDMVQAAKMPERKHVNVRGREEHEALIRDAAWCKELGLDQYYETMVYLKRWGGWLSE
jgi:hypothetical protein